MNLRSMHSSERIKEMVCELESFRWDAIFMSETWRPDKSEIWDTHHKHILMGAGKYDNKHGVGMMLNKKWRHTIIDTEYINERAITATIAVNPTWDMRITTLKNVQNDREAHDKLQNIHTNCWRRQQC